MPGWPGGSVPVRPRAWLVRRRSQRFSGGFRPSNQELCFREMISLQNAGSLWLCGRPCFEPCWNQPQRVWYKVIVLCFRTAEDGAGKAAKTPLLMGGGGDGGGGGGGDGAADPRPPAESMAHNNRYSVPTRCRTSLLSSFVLKRQKDRQVNMHTNNVFHVFDPTDTVRA